MTPPAESQKTQPTQAPTQAPTRTPTQAPARTVTPAPAQPGPCSCAGYSFISQVAKPGTVYFRCTVCHVQEPLEARLARTAREEANRERNRKRHKRRKETKKAALAAPTVRDRHRCAVVPLLYAPDGSTEQRVGSQHNNEFSFQNKARRLPMGTPRSVSQKRPALRILCSLLVVSDLEPLLFLQNFETLFLTQNRGKKKKVPTASLT